MKFISILLSEGRKEDLRDKYIKSMDPTVLDWILNISDLVDFNHKYTDFVLRTLDRDSQDLDMDVEVAIQLIKDFDKYQSQLEKKDINQYQSISELENALKPVLDKKKEKELEKQVDKIYEDDKFLVVIPKTEEASCKYGSNTKWCVTQKGAGHYRRYTSGSQVLYFIINKANSTNQNYSKVAIHFDNSGNATFWDSKDMPLGNREIEILEYAFPEMIGAIKKHYKENIEIDRSKKIIIKSFDEFGITISKISNFLNTGKELRVKVKGFENIHDLGYGHAQGFAYIILMNEDGESYEELDGYDMFITYGDGNGFFVNLEVGFMGIENENYIDTGFEGFPISFNFKFGIDPKINSESLRRHISEKMLHRLKDNDNLKKHLYGTTKIWRPNRSSYGYTFKSSDKGLVKKLIDYLDSGEIGTKLDFLEKIGKLTSKIEDGKKLYSISGRSYFRPKKEMRGHFSSFFASAVLAGILGYRKVGRDYFLIKGPNFDEFKEGKLKAL